jgi:site-specific DNA recombinase
MQPQTAANITPVDALAGALAPKAAVSYLRVSTKRQAERGADAEGFSIPAQRDANRKKAQSLGALIVKEFVDRGESARSANRPELQRMLEYLRENDVDYVVVHKIDRLARNREDDVLINRAFTEAGVSLVSTTESIDETPSGMLLHGIMASIAEFYSRNLANEVVKGMTQKARRGGTVGRAPLGYRNTSLIGEDGREARTVVLDPDRAPLIRWAFEEYAKGERGLRSIAEELAARGLRTLKTPNVPSKVLDEVGLQKLLTKPYYTGVVTFQGATYPGRHPAIIDDETFQVVQQVLASRRVGERRRTHDHYLKSTLRCGNCGARLIVQMTKNSKGNLYPYFICNGRYGKKNGCELKAVLIDEVEAKVEDYYAELASRLTPDFLANVEAMVVREFQTSRTDVESAIKQLTSEREKLERERERVLQAHYADAIPLDLLKKEQERITAGLRENARQRARHSADMEAIEDSLHLALDLLRDCPAAYRDAPDHMRKLLNQVFFEHVLVFTDGSTRPQMLEPFATLTNPAGTTADEKSGTSRQGSAAQRVVESSEPDQDPGLLSGICFGKSILVPLEGLEPPTLSLGRNCSSIELQRLTARFYGADPRATSARIASSNTGAK